MRCCCLWLAEAYEAQGMLWHARRQYGRFLQINPFDEDILCRLMAMLYRHGMVADALACYQEAKHHFRGEGLSLSHTTKQLAEKLVNEPLSPELYLAPELPQRDGLKDTNLPASSLAYMVQYTQTVLPKVVPAEQSISLPLALSMPMSSSDLASSDCAAWFAARVSDLKALGGFGHRSTLTYQQQQALIHSEIEAWHTMTNQDSTGEYHITRRMALVTLATLSSSLIARVQLEPLSTLLIEEFLTQCATSITTCWHLMQGRELGIVQQALTHYLPILRSWTKHPSPYQKTSAYLASQGCLLMGLLSLHSFPVPQNFSKRLFYCAQATEYAHLSTDPILQITALAHLANAHYDMGQLDKMLQTYQKATSTLDDLSKHCQFPSLLCSKLQIELAHAYAQHGQVQQALSALEEAQVLFPGEHEEAPVFLSTDYGHHSLILFEGLTHLDLEKYVPNNHHSHQAARALAKIETVSISEQIPERFRVEIFNQQALAAIREGKLEEFEKYHIKGVKGAQALASEKRRQEAIMNWKIARERWPHEARVQELADLLF